MDVVSVLLAFFPVVAIFFLLLVYRVAADTAGYIGWLVAAAVAVLYFGTSIEVVLTASAAGLVASLPIALVMAASIVQITLMQETGAVARVVALMKTIAPGQQTVQIMIINVGFGILLTSLGAVTVSILPPIMIALGYSTFAAILLPAIGYDALCTYALLGIPAVVFAQFVGKPVGEVGMYFAQYMPVISTCIALGMLQLTGGFEMVKKGFVPALIAGVTAGLVAIFMAQVGLVTITGIAAGLAVILMLVLWPDLVRVGHAIIGPIYTAFFCTTMWFSWETVRHKLYPRINAWMCALAATCWYITEILGEIYNLGLGNISNIMFCLVWVFYGTNVVLWALSGFRWNEHQDAVRRHA